MRAMPLHEQSSLVLVLTGSTGVAMRGRTLAQLACNLGAEIPSRPSSPSAFAVL